MKAYGLLILIIITLLASSCGPSNEEIQATANALAYKYMEATKVRQQSIDAFETKNAIEATAFWAEWNADAAEEYYYETVEAGISWPTEEYDDHGYDGFATAKPDYSDISTTPDPADYVNPTTQELICIYWEEAASEIGATTCVHGVVSHTYNSGNAFFINFDNSQTSFYAVSFTHFPSENLVGQCLEISGKIETYKGRPQIIIENPSTQISPCD